MTTHPSTILTRLACGALAALALTAPASRAQTRTVAQRVSASQPAIIAAEVDDANSRQAMYSVRGDLRQLVMAQESFWRARHTYATDVTFLPTFHPAPGVVVQIVRARADGWTARAAYGDAGGSARSCAIWVGDVGSAERPTTDAERKVYPEAEVSCDGDGYTTRGEWGAAGRSYMTYALRKLVQSEARFFAFHQRYTTDPAALDPFIWDREVSVVITAGTPLGWAARATFAGAPGKTCVIWGSVLVPSDIPATAVDHVTPGEAQVACDN
jgi:hypothetical protein